MNPFDAEVGVGFKKLAPIYFHLKMYNIPSAAILYYCYAINQWISIGLGPPSPLVQFKQDTV